jgi:hypothetical protein
MSIMWSKVWDTLSAIALLGAFISLIVGLSAVSFWFVWGFLCFALAAFFSFMSGTVSASVIKRPVTPRDPNKDIV